MFVQPDPSMSVGGKNRKPPLPEKSKLSESAIHCADTIFSPG